MKKRKDRRLRNIIRQGGYFPYRGYIDWDFVDGVWQEVGKYIKYPKNSNRQQYLKRTGNHIVRRYPDLPHKGNLSRRVFDYWLELN